MAVLPDLLTNTLLGKCIVQLGDWSNGSYCKKSCALIHCQHWLCRRTYGFTEAPHHLLLHTECTYKMYTSLLNCRNQIISSFKTFTLFFSFSHCCAGQQKREYSKDFFLHYALSRRPTSHFENCHPDADFTVQYLLYLNLNFGN